MSEVAEVKGADSAGQRRSLGSHMLHGSAWMIGVRWTFRLMGLFSTVVLARLLTPTDFGVVAMAMIVVGLLEALSPSGQKLALIRLMNPDREHYDTVWTLSVAVGLVIAAVIVAMAPLTVYYYHDSRAIPVMQCLALRSAMGGFENVGVLDFRRNLHFRKVFLYNVYPKLVSFFVTIAAAIVLRSYWALVLGILTMSFTSNVLSFTMHSYRPRFSLARLNELWSFSAWTLLRSIGWSLNFQVDQLVLGWISGAAPMGRYAVASDIASSPSRELNDPMVAVLYPVMAKVQHDPAQLRTLYLKILAWSAIICISTSVGVALVAHDVVWVVLGPKWHAAEPLMGYLALSAGLIGLSSGVYTTFDALGQPALGARMQWLRVALLCAAIIPAGLLWRDLQAIAITRLLVIAIFMPTLFLAAANTIGVTASEYVTVLWRPVCSAVVMCLGVYLVSLLARFEGALHLVLLIGVGALCFVGSSLLLWRMARQPDAPEKDLLQYWKRNNPWDGQVVLATTDGSRRGWRKLRADTNKCSENQ